MPWVQRALSFFLLYELSTLFMDIILFLRVISKDSGLLYARLPPDPHSHALTATL